MDHKTSHAIDIYRGFLAQYVIIAHLIPALFPGVLGVPGTLAVWAFFVTSGFLNFYSYTRGVSAISYYKKRILRLYPLLIVSFIAIVLIEGTWRIHDIYTLFPVVFWLEDHMPHNGVLWTIIIELQLYAMTPILALPLLKRSVSDRQLVFLLWLLPVVSIGMSVVASETYQGSFHLGERTFLSAIPMYFFGMALAKYHQENKGWPIFFQNKILWIVTLVLFVGVVLFRNSSWGVWDHLFAEGRFIAFSLTAMVLTAPAFLKFFSAQGLGVKLGQLTYEIYLFHGLMAYVMSVYIPKASAVTIILFFWVLPVFMSFGWEFIAKKIVLFSQGKKS